MTAGTSLAHGFACSGALAVEQIADLARDCEQAGYRSFWITVIDGITAPAGVLRAAVGATTRIDVGLGLIPLDAYDIGAIAREISDLGERSIVGLGVGHATAGAPGVWRDGAHRFRSNAPGVRLAVGSYGPRVLRAGGASADAALLNWMTPARVRWSQRQLAAGARAAGRSAPHPVYVYLPTAIGQGARSGITAALDGMARRDYHRRHQTAIGATDSLGLALDRPDALRCLPSYGEGTETVICPIARDFEAHAAILHASAPS